MTANGYVRQSTAQIVDGQVINASDSNNEYNALLNAFNGTTGHDHSGGTGLGQKINLTGASIGVTGVLDPSLGGIKVIAADPTATDATPNYVPGTIWINSSSKAAFVCLDNTASAAVWQRLPAGTITGSNTIPSVNDDSTKGYRIGSLIVNTTQNDVYFCTSNTAAAATWACLHKGRLYSATTNPTANDDNTRGYVAGSIGVNTSSLQVFVALSVGTGTASWAAITGTKPGLATTTAQSSGFTAVAGTLYPCDVTSAGFTVTLPASASLNDMIGFIIYGNTALTLNPNGLKVNGSTANLPIIGEQTLFITYSGASRGWV